MRDDNPIAFCSRCRKKGQLLEITQEGMSYIHKKEPMSKLLEEPRSLIKNSERFVSSIQCGYESSYDSFLLVLTPRQDRMIPDLLCNECLEKALSTQKKVQCHDYLFSSLKRYFIKYGIVQNEGAHQ